MVDHPLDATPTGGWSDEAQVAWYLERIGKLEARQAGERMLVEVLNPAPERILDLGCGDGRLAALVLANRPTVRKVVAVDCSAPMLDRARRRFADDRRVTVLERDLRQPITPLGSFDLIMSGFAIHHLDDARKRALYHEVAGQLQPDGMFVNLEVVASASGTAARLVDIPCVNQPCSSPDHRSSRSSDLDSALPSRQMRPRPPRSTQAPASWR